MSDLPTGELDGELVLTGRIMPASNATFLATIDGEQVVYKPVAGERPLWDFPDGTLAERERAAYLVSRASGWDIVPPTWLRDGPRGPGMTQLWREPDPEQQAVALVPAGKVPDGWHAIFDGVDQHERPVTLTHEESSALRRMAVFDIVVNNADRKGGHVLEMPGGHRYGVDHGLTLHVEPKLRTVLWGWIGLPLDAGEIAGVERVLAELDDGLGRDLAELITAAELEGLAARCAALLADPVFPAPPGDSFALPWPPF